MLNLTLQDSDNQYVYLITIYTSVRENNIGASLVKTIMILLNENLLQFKYLLSVIVL